MMMQKEKMDSDNAARKDGWVVMMQQEKMDGDDAARKDAGAARKYGLHWRSRRKTALVQQERWMMLVQQEQIGVDAAKKDGWFYCSKNRWIGVAA